MSFIWILMKKKTQLHKSKLYYVSGVQIFFSFTVVPRRQGLKQKDISRSGFTSVEYI